MSMNSEKSLVERIHSEFARLSPSQRAVGSFILSSYRSLAYVTLAELSGMTSKGQGTVVRFAQTLGYGSFSGLRAALREEIERASPGTLEMYSSEKGEGGEAEPYEKIFEMERALMEDTYRLIDRERFNAAVRIISEAPAVIVSGTGSNSFLAKYAGYFLGTMKNNVLTVTDSDLSGMNSIIDAPEGAAGFVFSFPRYPVKTQPIVQAMKKRGIRTVGITDSMISPIAGLCDHLFLVPQRFMSFMDPYSAVMSLIHSILYGVYLSDREKCRMRMEARRHIFEGEKLFVSENVHLPDLMP